MSNVSKSDVSDSPRLPHIIHSFQRSNSMNTFLDLVYSLIVTPRAALYDITRGERLREAGILWLFTLFLTAVSAFSEGPGLLVEFLAVLLFLGLSLLVHSAVTDYLSGLLSGQGSAKGITAGFMAHRCHLPFPSSLHWQKALDFPSSPASVPLRSACGPSSLMFLRSARTISSPPGNPS